MSQELIDAANTLKAAADALLEVATRPAFSLANMTEEDKKALRELINPWFEKEVGERLTELEETVENLDIDTKVEEAVEDKVSDMGNWDELDPNEVSEAVYLIQNRLPDVNDLENLVDNIDVGEHQVAVATAQRLNELVERLEPVLKLLDPLRPKPAVTEIKQAS